MQAAIAERIAAMIIQIVNLFNVRESELLSFAAPSMVSRRLLTMVADLFAISFNATLRPISASLISIALWICAF
jgi:hypothetical protein